VRIVGEIVIGAGIFFILVGVIGIVKYENFFTRILVTAKIDTVGVITVFLGMAIRHGAGFFSLKVLLLVGIVMILNPLTSHMIARSAYLSGYKPEAQAGANNDDNKDYL